MESHAVECYFGNPRQPRFLPDSHENNRNIITADRDGRGGRSADGSIGTVSAPRFVSL